MKKQVIIVVILLVMIGAGFYFYHDSHKKEIVAIVPNTTVPTKPEAQVFPDAHSFNGLYADDGYGKQDSSYGNGISIYADSPTTILFYMDLYQAGNLGTLYDTATETAPGVFTYYSKDDEFGNVCNFTMTIQNTTLTVKSIGDVGDGCGFGYGVTEEGVYIKKDTPAPQYFIDGTGTKHFFKDTAPGSYSL